ncbi:hypothetical protein FQN55_002919 [Onygenales sp. PD_40]|nr:hypothetical protein FQN55_002919 [Onygenales sp. PD_40]
MADPISIVGTAVGVVALGLAVSNSLVSYYDAWTHCEYEVESILHPLRTLVENFRLVEKSLKSGDFDPELTAIAEKSIESCNAGILALRRKLEKIQLEKVPCGIKERTRSAVIKSQYGFKQKTILKLSEIVSNLKDDVSFVLQTLNLDALATIMKEIKGIRGGIDALNKIHVDDEKRDIHRWLKAPDPFSNYYAASQLRREGTGIWLLEGKEYATWVTSPNSIIWLHGIPGCGKTILSSNIIKNLAETCPSDSQIVFFYFDFKDSDKQTCQGLLCSLVTQLSTQHAMIPKGLKQLHTRHADTTPPCRKELMDTLHEMVANCSNTYIVLDALDECTESRELVGLIQDIFEWNIDTLHLMLTSRKEKLIDDSFQNFVRTRICLESTLVDDDIQLHIQKQMEEEPRFRKLSMEDRLTIERTLAAKSNGMFRWAICQMEVLRRCRNVKSLREKLNSLPKDLDTTYERILLSISDEDSSDVMTILKWLAFSRHPLSIEEISEVVTIDLEANPPVFDVDRRYHDPWEILEMCSSLVVVTHMFDKRSRMEKDILQFAHFSVKEYLLSERIRISPAHKYAIDKIDSCRCIAECCLAYLFQFNHDQFGPELCEKSYLASYAAFSWRFHTRDAEDQDTVLELAAEMVTSKRIVVRNAFLLIAAPELGWDLKYIEHLASPLYLAAQWGFIRVAKTLVNPISINEVTGHYGTALNAACSNQYPHVVRLLLDSGADANLQISYLQRCPQETFFLGNALATTVASCASMNREKSMVAIDIADMLINSGAEVNPARESWREDKYYREPLLLALPNDAMFEFLLSKSAETDLWSNGALLPEIVATIDVMPRRVWWVNMILKYGANLNPEGEYFGSTLAYACRFVPVQAISCLRNYKYDAMSGRQDYRAWEAFDMRPEALFGLLVTYWKQKSSWASIFDRRKLQWDFRRIFGILKNIMADVPSRGHVPSRGLEKICLGFETTAVEQLLKHGVDVTPRGATRAFREAAYLMDCGKVPELFDWAKPCYKESFGDLGANLNATAEETARILLRYFDIHAEIDESGNIVNIEDNNTPPDLDDCSPELVELLLEYGADDSELKDDSHYQAMKKRIEETNRHIDELVKSGREKEIQSIRNSRYARAVEARLVKEVAGEEILGEVEGGGEKGGKKVDD